MPVSVDAIKPRRSLLDRYRDYASRNWPVWWSLKLGMPLAYMAVIVFLTAVTGLLADVGDLKTLVKQIEQEPDPTFRPEILHAMDAIIVSLVAIPLFIGVLFSFLWYFLVGRSLKFTRAPALGRQPSILPLALVGCCLLWAGLVGFKLFQWKNCSIELLDFSSFGSVYGNTSSGAIRVLRGEAPVTPALFVASGFTFCGAAFLGLQRQLGFNASLSGLVYIVIVTILGATLAAADPLKLGPQLFFGLLFGLLLFGITLIGLNALLFRRRLSGLHVTGISTLLYLLTFGPVSLFIFSPDIEVSAWLQSHLVPHPVGAYFLCLSASLAACEFVFWIIDRHRLRPS